MKSKVYLWLLLFSALIFNPNITWAQQEIDSTEPLSYLNVPLQPRAESATADDSRSGISTVPGFNEALVKMGGSLAVVLSLFLGIVWFTRRRRSLTGIRLGDETLEVMGQTTLTKNHSLHVVRLGERLLLVSAGESEVACLTEITDPVEVEQLLATTKSPNTSSSTFKSLFAQYDQNPNQLYTDT